MERPFLPESRENDKLPPVLRMSTMDIIPDNNDTETSYLYFFQFILG